MQDAINEQINWEIYSGYLYLSMAAQFSGLGMSGGQNWMTVQYQEELAHAQKMFDYVTTRGGRVTLTEDPHEAVHGAQGNRRVPQDQNLPERLPKVHVCGGPLLDSRQCCFHGVFRFGG